MGDEGGAALAGVGIGDPVGVPCLASLRAALRCSSAAASRAFRASSWARFQAYLSSFRLWSSMVHCFSSRVSTS